MRKHLSVAAFVAITITLCAGVASSQMMRGGWGMGYGDMVYGREMMNGGMYGGGMMGSMLCGMTDGCDWDAVAKTLNLTPQQRDQLMMKNGTAMRMMLEAHNQLRLDMFDLSMELRKPMMDQTKIDKLIDAVAGTQRQILADRVKSMEEMKNVLTAEQWNKFRHMGMMEGQPMCMMPTGTGTMTGAGMTR
jgi:Spy/CpxP family protein refolding chaperone